jgi:hypothetical protein
MSRPLPKKNIVQQGPGFVILKDQPPTEKDRVKERYFEFEDVEIKSVSESTYKLIIKS